MMNEVNIIETYSNNKNMQQEAVDTTKWFWQIETYITSPVFTYTNTSDLYHHPQSIFNWPKSVYTQHFRSISSSTINLQILTKKKQIRGNKVPNDGDGDEAQSELQQGRGREAEMSVREWAAIWAELRRRGGREAETREWLRLWESEEEIWAELR